MVPSRLTYRWHFSLHRGRGSLSTRDKLRSALVFIVVPVFSRGNKKHAYIRVKKNTHIYAYKKTRVYTRRKNRRIYASKKTRVYTRPKNTRIYAYKTTRVYTRPKNRRIYVYKKTRVYTRTKIGVYTRTKRWNYRNIRAKRPRIRRPNFETNGQPYGSGLFYVMDIYIGA